MAVPGRLRWLCRRGTRELEVLLESTIEQWDAMFSTDAERDALDRLLHLQDPELYDLLTGRREAPDAAMAAVCRKLSPHLVTSRP